MDETTSKVYLVGAGPGDPGLITQKGISLLKKCDVVIYDRLVSARLLNYVKKGCKKIYVGKTVGSHTIKQEEINRIIVENALSSRVVVRLKGGDPFVFGRGGEEVLALKAHGIPYEVIPGVTSAIAAAAFAGIPITHRGVSQSFHVITGHTADEAELIPEDFKILAKLQGTLVILMGIGNLGKIKDELLANGKSIHTPVAVVASGTTIWQKEVRGTLEDICRKVEEAQIKAPAIIIIGDVAKLDLRAFEEFALSGVRIGITGTKAVTDKLTEQLEELRAQVETVCTSEIVEYENNIEFENALKSLEQYQWIVFTSTNAVNLYFNKMKELRIDHRRLAHIKFAAVGSGTGQALVEHGILVDFIPQQYTVSNLAKELSNLIGDKERLLIPRAEQGSQELIEILHKNRKTFDDIKIYDIKEVSEYPADLNDINKQFDYLTFASSSGVHSFFMGLKKSPKEMLGRTKVVCIGESTEAALKEYDYHEAFIAKESSIKGLVERICELQLFESQASKNVRS